MRSLRLEELKWPEITAAIANGFDTVVFGVGATEQHGPHLPLATDALLADWLSEATARRLGHALAAPTIRVGCSQHHLSFAGTISIEASTLKALIANYVTTLLGHGFRRAIVIPSHGGNFEVVSQTVAELGRQLPEKQIVTFCDLERLLEVSHKVCNQYGISAGAAGAHAGELETSILLFLRPDLVDMTRAEEGFTGDITPIVPDLLKYGLQKVTANGILGDARLGDGSRGEQYLQAWLDLIMHAVEQASVAA